MNTNIIIFGASKLGIIAYEILKDDYNIIYYCDNDNDKWGKEINGIEVISPQKLSELQNHNIIIASSYYKEISQQLQNMGIYKFKILKYGLENFELASWNSPKKDLNIKNINLGSFLSNLNNPIQIDDITFLPGGSSVLDYAFLKALMIKFNFKTYLEIGTWMGESIAAISEVAEKCYSVSLPDEDPSLTKYFKEINNKNNFSRFFSKEKNNIVHFYEDSKVFDFSKIPDKIDLVFIDGDHKYEGVKTDTENIFKIININETIVVWHDFKEKRNEYIMSTVKAIYDAIPGNLNKNIFGVDNNMCGVYIPDKYLEEFTYESDPNNIYSYNTTIKPKLNTKIDSINIELTNRCNLNCKMCFRNELDRPIQDLDLSQYKKILDMASEVGVKKIMLAVSGEPLIYRNLIEAIKLAEKKFEVSLITNGVLLDNNLANEILSTNLQSIQFSVTGYTNKVFKKFQGYNSKIDVKDIYKNIENFLNLNKEKSNSIKTIVRYILCDESLDEIQEYINHWKTKVDDIQITPLYSFMGRNKKIKYDYKEKKFKKCDVLGKTLTILSNGDTTLCCNDHFGENILGNIEEKSLREILISNKFNQLKHLNNEIETNGIKSVHYMPKGCKNCDYLISDYKMGYNIHYSSLKKFVKVAYKFHENKQYGLWGINDNLYNIYFALSIYMREIINNIHIIDSFKEGYFYGKEINKPNLELLKDKIVIICMERGREKVEKHLKGNNIKFIYYKELF